ncbi:uncharacterized protein LOC125026921 [Penaeus chinensis]|uniref:uncharacterized protein LOC125026921 n=1 Tax=Penaeus chinensis TaxID=139456 RepID=UPI001FB5CD81|nr:uncharacterized protein LOC125026921 [Penaeus chinensis]
MSLNQENQNLITLEGGVLKRVDDFLYLGSWIGSSAKDIETKISKAWLAMNKMELIWKSDIPKETKISFFRTSVESVLLNGCGAWTLTQTLEKKLDGACTKMQSVVQNVNWCNHVSNKTLYGSLPKITTTIAQRRLRFAGHCWRSKQEVVHKLLLWELAHGRRSGGRPALTFIDQLIKETNITKEQLPGAMGDPREYPDLPQTEQFIRDYSSWVKGQGSSLCIWRALA